MRASRLAAAVLLAAIRTAEAGGLHVGPTRIELTPERRVATLEVRNDGAAPIIVQLERMDWTQSDGQDVYQPTADLIATPLVFPLASGAAQIVRIGLRTWPSDARQRAFRLYVREVPQATAAPGAELQLALRIGVPVFAGPTGTAPSFVCSMRRNADGTATLELQNAGTGWARIAGMDARSASGTDEFWRMPDPFYLLAGSTTSWTRRLDHAPGSSQVVLRVRTESETLSIGLPPLAP